VQVAETPSALDPSVALPEVDPLAQDAATLALPEPPPAPSAARGH
jgi:hypothetical protein